MRHRERGQRHTAARLRRAVPTRRSAFQAYAPRGLSARVLRAAAMSLKPWRMTLPKSSATRGVSSPVVASVVK